MLLNCQGKDVFNKKENTEFICLEQFFGWFMIVLLSFFFVFFFSTKQNNTNKT